MFTWTLKLLSPSELVPNRSRSRSKSLERSTYGVGRGWRIRDEFVIVEPVKFSTEADEFFDLRLVLMLNVRFYNLIEKEETQCSRRGAYKDINWCSGQPPPHILSVEVNLAVCRRPTETAKIQWLGANTSRLFSWPIG